MRRAALPAVLLVAGASLPALGGCESTQAKNARAERTAGAQVSAEVGIDVSAENADVKAASTTLLTDPEVGSAVVVELKSAADASQYELPVLVKVTGADGAEVFTNATPGLQRSLTHAAVVDGDGTTVWVNDQIPVTQGAESATAVVGPADGVAPTTPVRFKATASEVTDDPVSGAAATGFVKHDGADEQRRVVVTVIARKGKKIVAAGRGIVARVKAGKRAPFQAFLIGDPMGAELTASAQPNIDPE